MDTNTKNSSANRRSFLNQCVQGTAIFALGALSGTAVNESLSSMKTGRQENIWQIDPQKCIACNQCAQWCVLDQSAVRCYHDYNICNYCKQCFGFFAVDFKTLNDSVENQMCPLGAIHRKCVNEPYFEYVIDQEVCIGCGKCVDGCNTFGDGALYLQIDQSRCAGCNECAIALKCPSHAIARTSSDAPYASKRRRAPD